MKNPWELTPIKLYETATESICKGDEHNQLIAYLLLDVCAENTLKTFVTVAHHLHNLDISFRERNEVINGNYHNLVEFVFQKLSKTSIEEYINKEHLKYYHTLRNKLYHDGGGIAISLSHVNEYHKIVGLLIHEVLRIEFEVKKESIEEDLSEMTMANLDEIKSLIEKIEVLSEKIIEKIDYRLVMPSFKYKLNNFYMEYSHHDISYIDDFLKEYLQFDCKANLSKYFRLYDEDGNIGIVNSNSNDIEKMYQIINNFKLMNGAIVENITYNDFTKSQELYLRIVASLMKKEDISIFNDVIEWSKILILLSNSNQEEYRSSNYESDVSKALKKLEITSIGFEKYLEFIK